jgi:EAL domain-containing protein (putative c-di-GMP-specific phosphodiesterase class I)
MGTLTKILGASEFAPRVMLELTEDAFVAKSRFQLHVLPMLREIGAKVSIDDFGTGYSSLSALADITADELKVDRSFISSIHERPRSQSVLRAIESLGHALGMTIMAEGVETFEELAYLQTSTRIRQAQATIFPSPSFSRKRRARLSVGDAIPALHGGKPSHCRGRRRGCAKMVDGALVEEVTSRPQS